MPRPTGDAYFDLWTADDDLRAKFILDCWGAGGLPSALPDTVTLAWNGDANVPSAAQVDRLLINSGADQGVSGLVHEMHVFRPTAITKPARLIYCAGHGGIGANDYAYIDHFVSRGHVVVGTSMPLYAPSPTSATVTVGVETTTLTTHDDFSWFEGRIAHTLPLWINMKIRAVNWLHSVWPGCLVHAYGLSGGGWGCCLFAAVDTRVTYSFPVAGFIPWAVRSEPADYEQTQSRSWYSGRDWYDFMAMAGGGHGRACYVTHNYLDPVAFSAQGRESTILNYDRDSRRLRLPGLVPGLVAGRIDHSLDSAPLHVISDETLAFIEAVIG